MAKEIQATATTAWVVYAIIRNSVGQVYRTDTHVFETYATANLANYTITLTEQGTASGAYVGDFPTFITAGIYGVVAYRRVGGSAAEGDTVLAAGNIDWNGATVESVGVALPANIAPGAANGVFIAGTNAATVITTSLTTHFIGTVDTVTTLTNLPSIPNNWLTAAGIAASALNGKGDWLLASSYTAPPSVASIVTGVWTDTVAGDFTVALSVGKSIMNGVTLGTGLTVARCTLTDTLTTYTGNTPQTGDAYAIVNSGTFGNAKLVRSTTPANTLDVSVTGEAGVDWANVGGQSTAVNLSATTVNLVNTVTTVTNQLTAAQIATGVWQDATAGDFTVASSIGKALYINNVAPGGSGGHLISGSNAGTTTLGALTVTGAVSLGSTLGVTGATTLTGNVTMAAGLTINQSTLNGSALVLTGNGVGRGCDIYSGSDGSALAIIGTGGTGNVVYISSLGSGNALRINGNATVSGTTTLAGAVSLGSTLDVTGTTTLADLNTGIITGIGFIFDNPSGYGGYLTGSAGALSLDGANYSAPGLILSSGGTTSALDIQCSGSGPAVNIEQSGIGDGIYINSFAGGGKDIHLAGSLGLRVDGTTTLTGAVTASSDSNSINLGAAGLAKFFTLDTTKVYANAVAGSVVKEIALGSSGLVTVPTAAQNATAVWTDLLAGSDFGTVASIGKLLKDDTGVDTPGTTTLLSRIASTLTITAGGVTLADGVAHGGTPGSSTATFALQSMLVANPNGTAVQWSSTGNNGFGFTTHGNGTGSGTQFSGGSSGSGMLLIGGSALGYGLGILSFSATDAMYMHSSGGGKALNVSGPFSATNSSNDIRGVKLAADGVDLVLPITGANQMNLRQAINMIAAGVMGKTSGAGTLAENYLDVGDGTTVRIAGVLTAGQNDEFDRTGATYTIPT